MDTAAQFLLTLGCILLLGLAADYLGRHTFLPRVTLLLIFGVIIGEDGLGLVSVLFSNNFEIIADMTLLMVGFLLGGKLTIVLLRESSNQILWISISAAIGSVIIVILGLCLMGVPLPVAIILGCLAAATDPAASIDSVMESNHKSIFSKILLSIVALDDGWALILFSLGLAIVAAMSGLHPDVSVMTTITHELGGALIVGLVMGTPAAYLTGRVKKGQPILSEALGLVLVCGGLALWLDVSFLIASMVMGAVIANLARHHERPFHSIEDIEWPFMIIFFVLAGTSFDISALEDIGLIGSVYIICRVFGKIIGAYIGGYCSKADTVTCRWMGLAMLPQAGVAMGMALVAANKFPEYKQLLLSVVISTTVFFEIIGPVFARIALRQANKKLN
jgi:Kef-type K+ transport system membrane component KefB